MTSSRHLILNRRKSFIYCTLILKSSGRENSRRRGHMQSSYLHKLGHLGREDRLHADNEMSQFDLQFVLRVSHSRSHFFLQERPVRVPGLSSEHCSSKRYQLHARPSEGLYQGYPGLSAEQVTLHCSCEQRHFLLLRCQFRSAIALGPIKLQRRHGRSL